MVDYHNNVSDRFILLPPNTDDKIICNHYTPRHARHPEIIQNQLPNRNDLCETHDWEEIKFYCQSCKTGICRDCGLLYHRSARDFVRPETKACDQQRIIRILQDVEAEQAVLTDQLEQLDVDFKNRKTIIDEAKKVIQSTTTRLKTLIKEQEEMLTSCLDGKFKSVSRNITGRKTALMSALDDVNQGLQIAREMSRRKPVAAGKSPNLGLKNIPKQETTVHEHGGVAMETCPLPVNQKRNESDEIDDNVCNLKLDEAKKPEQILPSDLDIQKNDIRIVSVTRSPTAKATLPQNCAFQHLLSFGEHGNGSGQFEDPVGVTTSQDGTSYVADYTNDRLQVFDKSGHFLRTMSHVTTQTGRKVSFLCPTGLATDKSGNIVIAERGRHRITVMNPEGELQQKFGKLGKTHGQFRDPHGVSVDRRGRIIVADTSNNRIQVFDQRGDFIFAFGNHGEHVLDYPNYAIFHQGMFIVSDTDNDCVKIFDKDGHFLRTLGATKDQGGPLSAPSGLAIYRDNYIVVCDFNNDCVKIYSLGGDLVTKFGREGTGPGQFSGPEAVTVTSDNLIIVTDKNNSRVQTFGFN